MAAQSLLVAIDGSANSLRALRHAIVWSAALGQQLHLVFVQPRIKRSRVLSQALIEEHQARQTESAFRVARRLLKRAPVAAKFEVRFGEPSSELVTYARRNKCSHIVIGNRGQSAIAGLLLGSVAMKVVHLAPVPVTLVK